MLGGAKPPRPSDTPPIRRGKGGTAFEDERSEAANLPKSLLIGGKGGCIPPNRREGRLYPS